MKTCSSCSGKKKLSGFGGAPVSCLACAGIGKLPDDAPVIRIVLTTYLPQSSMYAAQAFDHTGQRLAVRADHTEDGLKCRLGFGDLGPHLAYARRYPSGYQLEYERTIAHPLVRAAMGGA